MSPVVLPFTRALLQVPGTLRWTSLSLNHGRDLEPCGGDEVAPAVLLEGPGGLARGSVGYGTPHGGTGMAHCSLLIASLPAAR